MHTYGHHGDGNVEKFCDPNVEGVTRIYATHEEYEEKCLRVHEPNSEATVWEQGQYTAYEVEQEIEFWNDIFGAYGSLS